MTAQEITGTTADMERGKVLRRRGLIAGMAAVAAGVIAAKTADSVSANDGDNLRIGIQNVNSTDVTILGGSTTNHAGLLWVQQTGTDAGLAVTSTGVGEAINATSFKKNGVTSYTNIAGSAYAGVYGWAPANGNGVIGESTGSTGSYGVWGKTDSGKAVIGSATGPGTGVYGGGGQYGVVGQSDTTNSSIGVRGSSTKGFGVYGSSNGGPGVFGTTTASGNAGLAGLVSTPGTAAFAGTATVPTAFAGFFTGDVFIDGNFTVLDPTRKHGAITHPDGSNRILYSMESPESWLEDFGKGQLSNGKATVTLDPDFAAVVKMDDYHVFITPRDPACKGVAVTAQGADGFVVQELNGGSSNGAFSWRLAARPKTERKAARLAKYQMPASLHSLAANDLPKPLEPTKDPGPAQTMPVQTMPVQTKNPGPVQTTPVQTMPVPRK